MEQTFRSGFEKQAGFGFAAGLHVLQNLAFKRGLKHTGVTQHLAKGFSNAAQGKGISKARGFLEGVSSAAIPEYNISSKFLRGIGEKMNKSLLESGVEELTKRDLVLVRHLTRGNFTKLVGDNMTKSPQAQKILKAFQQNTGMNVSMMLNHDPAKAKRIARTLEGTWRSSSSDIQKRVLADVTTPIKGAKGLKGSIKIKPTKGDTTSGTELAGAAMGNLGLAIADPITAGVNMGKTLLSNPKSRKFLEKSKLSRKLLGKTEDALVLSPTKAAYTAGEKGKKLNKAKNMARALLLNAGTTDIGNFAHNAGRMNRQAQRMSGMSSVIGSPEARAIGQGLAKTHLPQLRANYQAQRSMQQFGKTTQAPSGTLPFNNTPLPPRGLHSSKRIKKFQESKGRKAA